MKQSEGGSETIGERTRVCIPEQSSFGVNALCSIGAVWTLKSLVDSPPFQANEFASTVQQGENDKTLSYPKR